MWLFKQQCGVVYEKVWCFGKISVILEKKKKVWHEEHVWYFRYAFLTKSKENLIFLNKVWKKTWNFIMFMQMI